MVGGEDDKSLSTLPVAPRQRLEKAGVLVKAAALIISISTFIFIDLDNDINDSFSLAAAGGGRGAGGGGARGARRRAAGWPAGASGVVDVVDAR